MVYNLILFLCSLTNLKVTSSPDKKFGGCRARTMVLNVTSRICWPLNHHSRVTSHLCWKENLMPRWKKPASNGHWSQLSHPSFYQWTKKPKDHFGVDGSNEWMRIANGTTALVSLRRIVSCRVKRAHLKKSQRERFESILASWSFQSR